MADSSGASRLWLRALDDLSFRPLPGTENALIPFWSPDSRWLGFFSDGRLKKVAIEGGAPVVICVAPDPRGATWGLGGDIVFAPTTAGPLYRVSADGGDAVEILRPDAGRKETAFRFPSSCRTDGTSPSWCCPAARPGTKCTSARSAPPSARC